jgi:uncharacterized protein YuzE
MQIKYFSDTDTLYVSFAERSVSEAKDLSEGVLLELDSDGQLVAITIEHAKKRADISNFSFQQSATEVVV